MCIHFLHNIRDRTYYGVCNVWIVYIFLAALAHWAEQRKYVCAAFGRLRSRFSGTPEADLYVPHEGVSLPHIVSYDRIYAHEISECAHKAPTTHKSPKHRIYELEKLHTFQGICRSKNEVQHKWESGFRFIYKNIFFFLTIRGCCIAHPYITRPLLFEYINMHAPAQCYRQAFGKIENVVRKSQFVCLEWCAQ